jgi:hypothetical protein
MMLRIPMHRLVLSCVGWMLMLVVLKMYGGLVWLKRCWKFLLLS